MKNLKDLKKLGVMLVAGALTMVIILPIARGELVYESQLSQSQHERDGLRKVLSSSHKAQAVAVVEHAETSDAPTVSIPAEEPTMAPATTPVSDVQNLSKAELMRRERVREEVKNEDILQERLEELRLRDERRRSEQLVSGAQVGASVQAGKGVEPMNSSQNMGSGIQNEVVVAPVTERPGQNLGQNLGQKTIADAGSLTDLSGSASTAKVSNLVLEEPDKTTLGLTGRLGISNMSSNPSFNVSPRYSAGVGLDVGVADTVTFELGYAFSEFGVAMASTNPWIAPFQMQTQNYSSNFETQVMKQNVFDAGLKIHLLNNDFRFRPFVGGGAGYSKSYINYDSRIIDYLNRIGLSGMAKDYEVSSVLGYLSTGFDVQITKGVSVGTLFKYYTVLTARENQPLNNMAFTGSSGAGYYPGYGYGYGYGVGAPYYQDPSELEKSIVGGSLARSNFYTLTAGVSFIF